jgi:hypothetical protein
MIKRLNSALMVERETGIEPATNSLEGCDSTTELLPPTRAAFAAALRRASPPLLSATHLSADNLAPSARDYPPAICWLANRSPPPCEAAHAPCWLANRSPPSREALRRAKVGGEGRTRTFEGAGPTDLQSAAFDRFATSPILRPHVSATRRARSGRPTAEGLCFVMSGFAPFANYTSGIGRGRKTLLWCSFYGAGEGIRTPDRLITNQLLYRTELRQPRQKSICSTHRATAASYRGTKGTMEKVNCEKH